MRTIVERQMRADGGVGLQDVANLITVDLETAVHGSALGLRTLFVPPEGHVPDRLTCVVVPHDGISIRRKTLHQAIEIASRDQAEVVLLHVAGPELPTEPGNLPAPRFMDYHGNGWSEWRQEFYRRFINCGADARVRLEVISGSVIESITEAARCFHADLLVLGLRHVGGSAGVGSVCHAAPCPVLLMRQDNHERSSIDA